ncbi:uncharacterized protein LOC113228751, partial [Hyposmocoma kahamanoa]|uniref:uncharacterized protein LOC113228751 n=1 Tax=Hyposmocoma kahamanoa TaxID=1477025 RepID=UPI000E6D5C68
MSVRLLDQYTRPIQLQRGVRQGDVISPKLFTTALEDAFKLLNWKGFGININGNLLRFLLLQSVCLLTFCHNDTDRKRQRALEESLKKDKGTGCFIPKLDPFSPEIMAFNQDLPQIVCNGLDWVKCNLSECTVVPSILNSTKDINCYFHDIIHKTDRDYYVEPMATLIINDEVFIVENSDNVKVSCTGRALANDRPMKWVGVISGLRSTVKPLNPPPGREKTINVLMFGFDTTSRNGFIRKMPESYKYLSIDLEATFLTGYNIIGDGTTAALQALLTGRNELEFPDARTRYVKTFLNNSKF